MIRRIGLIVMVMLLSACAAHTPLPSAKPELQSPLPVSLHIQRQAGDDTSDLLLVIQAQDQALRWSLFDPLGTPLARQQLIAGTWHADGLLPPNPAAQELFAALLFALSQDRSLEQNYPARSWKIVSATQRWLSPDWQISYRDSLNFTLKSANQVRYNVSPITLSEHP